jgi:hypothetical protein
MKARGLLGVLAFTVAALLGSPGLAAGATGKAGELKLGSFELENPGGYEIEVFTVQEGGRPTTAAVYVKKEPLETNYSVHAEAGPGIHATFDALGQLDVSFQRRKKAVERPERGCRWIFEEGVFRGSFHFTGEGGYVTSEATNPVGSMIRLPNGFCGFSDDRRARPFLGLERRVLAARAREASRTVSFEASQDEFVKRVSFSASLLERVDGVNIDRSAEATAGKGTFTSTGTARAAVRPPQPFNGTALFRDPAHQPASWSGSLSVSFLGASDVPLAGESFAARLCPHLSILSRCLKNR